jgi:hypothetical protein
MLAGGAILSGTPRGGPATVGGGAKKKLNDMILEAGLAQPMTLTPLLCS